MTMKKSLVASVVVAASLVAVIVLVGGRGGSHSQAEDDARGYITMAKSSTTATWWNAQFPSTPGTHHCAVPMGGLSHKTVPSTCTTIVLPEDRGVVTVKFVQSWNAGDFRGPRAGNRDHLSYTWETKLSQQALGKKLVSSRTYGDFPPQSVR
jgi:hypothetical protein